MQLLKQHRKILEDLLKRGEEPRLYKVWLNPGERIVSRSSDGSRTIENENGEKLTLGARSTEEK